MSCFIRMELLAAKLDSAAEACEFPDTEGLVLTSAAFGGGGQEGKALDEEMRLFGYTMKYAARCGKTVTITPLE